MTTHFFRYKIGSGQTACGIGSGGAQQFESVIDIIDFTDLNDINKRVEKQVSKEFTRVESTPGMDLQQMLCSSFCSATEDCNWARMTPSQNECRLIRGYTIPGLRDVPAVHYEEPNLSNNFDHICLIKM